jgi:hypothetical protein
MGGYFTALQCWRRYCQCAPSQVIYDRPQHEQADHPPSQTSDRCGRHLADVFARLESVMGVKMRRCFDNSTEVCENYLDASGT